MTIDRWNDEWRNQQNTKGLWTKTLIRDIKTWTLRNHGEVTYELCQILSGHGVFKKYLHRIGKRQDYGCPYCGCEVDDAEHTFYHCQEWIEQRKVLQIEVGKKLTQENTVETMLEDEQKWCKVKEFIELIMKKKGEDELNGNW